MHVINRFPLFSEYTCMMRLRKCTWRWRTAIKTSTCLNASVYRHLNARKRTDGRACDVRTIVRLVQVE